MKRLKIVVLASTVSVVAVLGISAAFAGNPLIQQCENYGGDFQVLAPGKTQDLPVCDFGDSSIGAVDFVSHLAGCSDQAVDAFLNSSASDASSVCDQNGAQELKKGSSYDLCEFPDGSVIDAATLAAGASDPQNSSLVSALNAQPQGPNDPNQSCQTENGGGN